MNLILINTKKIIVFTFLIPIIISCEQEVKKNIIEHKTPAMEKKETVKNKQKKNTISNRKIQLAVEGMMCQINCVSTIKKKLKSLNGISDVNVIFESKNPIDTLFIKYDSNLITSHKIVHLMESLNNSSYKVRILNCENFTIKKS